MSPDDSRARTVDAAIRNAIFGFDDADKPEAERRARILVGIFEGAGKRVSGESLRAYLEATQSVGSRQFRRAAIESWSADERGFAPSPQAITKRAQDIARDERKARRKAGA